MSQSLYFIYEQEDKTLYLNEHIAKLLSKGPYDGMLIQAQNPPSMFVDMTAGYCLTIEGVKIEENSDIENLVEIPAADASFPRKDLIVLRHVYVAGQTTPPGNYATYRVVTGTVPTSSTETPVAPYDQLDEYDIPLAEIWLPANATFIEDSMIMNLRRTMTTTQLEDYVARALYISLHNFAYRGWDAEDAGGLVLKVTDGEGLLCGKYNKSTDDYFIHSLIARSYLRPPNDPNTGDPYVVGENLSLLEQPDYPTELLITITTTNEATSGNIYVSGKGVDPNGPDIINHAIPVNQPANTSVTYYSQVLFSEVFLEGIDAQELVRSGSDIYINIKDRPIHYIYAVGTPTGYPFFRAELNPAYEPECNEMLIAKVETDETQIINIEDYSTGALTPITEQLTPVGDGVTRVFYLSQTPQAGTLEIYNDGFRMFENMPFEKGYIRDGKKITLQTNVPTPDANTLLVATYIPE